MLAIPHDLVVAFMVGGAGTLVLTDNVTAAVSFGGGLVSPLVLFAGVALLVRRSYPPGIYEAVVGMDRWVIRVVAYAALMTDAHPPFRLDQGGAEPLPEPRPDDPLSSTTTDPTSPTPRVPVLARCRYRGRENLCADPRAGGRRLTRLGDGAARMAAP